MARHKTSTTSSPPDAVETAPSGPVVVVLAPEGFHGGVYQRPRLPTGEPALRVAPGEAVEVSPAEAEYLLSTFPQVFTVKK